MKLSKEAIEIIEELMPIFDRWQSNHRMQISHTHFIKLQQVHIEIGAGFVNESCGDCLAHMLTLLWNNYTEHIFNLSKNDSKPLTTESDTSYQKLRNIALELGYDRKKGMKKTQLIKFINNN